MNRPLLLRPGEPAWLYEIDPDDTRWLDEDLPCIGHQDLYFSSGIDFMKARALCVGCPFRRNCTVWVLNHFEYVPYGTVAGLSESLRERIEMGTSYFQDWAERWDWGRYWRSLTRSINRTDKERTVKPTTSLPVCPCGHAQDQIARVTEEHNWYRCRECGAIFLEEAS